MRNLYLMAVLLVVAVVGYGQGDGYPDESGRPVRMTVQPWRTSGVPDGWVSRPGSGQPHVCAGGQVRGREMVLSGSFDPDGLVVDHADDASGYKVDATVGLGLGRRFVANNFTGGPPPDNSMAISNSGFIVSVDNTTIDYYRDTPDTLLQFQYHRTFFGDTLLYDLPYDPRVIYDRYSDRFIVVIAFTFGANSDLLISFSKSDDPRDGWNHYRVPADTLDLGRFIDYPQIAVNRDELFITGDMVNDTTGLLVGNILFQIKKQDGYDSTGLSMQIWPDILDPNGQMGFFLCPLSDGLMADSYNRGIYLASTEFLEVGQTGTELYWYHVTDSIGAAGVTITSTQLGSGQPYEVPPVGYQLGSLDNLDLGTCRVHSGFHLAGKLYFVYCKNTNGFGTIVLNRVDTQTNTLQRDGWGFSSGQQDDSYPSIAFAGVDSSDDSKLLMCYLRSGANIFPQMRAVYFDSVFPANSMLVKLGEGFVDLVTTAGVNERIGDYTAVQRRYGAATPTCWAVGSYPVGAAGNHFGQVNGLNGFIAEFTDSLANVVPEMNAPLASVMVYPNPTHDRLSIQSMDDRLVIRSISLLDGQGRVVHEWHGNWGSEPITLDVGDKSAGMYFISVRFKNESHVYFKVAVD